MTRPLWFAMLASAMAPGLISLAADNHACQGWIHDTPREPREGSVNNDYAGTVTEVTKDSITIQWVNSAGEKPKKFAVSETLAAGKVPKERRWPAHQPRNPALPNPTMPNPVMPEYMYRLTDVKVGDCVGIFYARINGVDICDQICISRRPNGLVPPLPKEAEDLRDWRKVWKAQHPGRSLPDWIAKPRYVPYHEFRNAYWDRIAPMPRTVPEPRPTQ